MSVRKLYTNTRLTFVTAPTVLYVLFFVLLTQPHVGEL